MSYSVSENRRKFCAVLAKLVLPLEPVEAANKLLTMLAGLEDIPEATFAKPGELAMAVGKGLTSFPSLGRLHKALEAQAGKSGGGTLLALPGAADDTLDREDRIALSVWLRHRASGFSHIDGPERLKMRVSLGVFRRHKDRVFAHICRTDEEAHGIAEEQHWLPRSMTEKPDVDAITASAANAIHALPNLGRPLTARRDRTEQTEGVTTEPAAVASSRADDEALLAALRSDLRAPNRGARIDALKERLGAA